MYFNGVFKEIQNSLRTVIVVSPDGSNKAGIPIDKAVEDNLPPNKSWAPV
jgi:hypothetical protein